MIRPAGRLIPPGRQGKIGNPCRHPLSPRWARARDLFPG